MVLRPIGTDNKPKENPTSSGPSGEELGAWPNPSPIMMPRPDPLNLPFQHYATVYLDNNGAVKFSASPSIGHSNRHIFTPELKEKFLEAAGIKPPSRLLMSRRSSRDDGNFHHSTNVNSFPSSHPRLQHRIGEPNGYDLDMEIGLEYDNDSSDSSQDRVPIEVGDSDKILAFYESAFRALQQLNCRQIAKAFIKVIEPRKQVRHPYNGGRPPPGSAPGERGDPELTKPDWWPLGVTHKEPDHLKKPERIRLLVHLFRELGRSHDIHSEKLREAGEEARRTIKPVERIGILDEVCKVRRFEERYERGEIDASTVIYVVNRDRTSARLNRDSESPEVEQVSDHEEGFTGQTTPTTTGPAVPLNTPVQYMDTGDRNSAFQVNYQIGVQDQMRTSQPFSTAAVRTHYNGLESQSIGATRAPSTVNHGDQAGMDYLSHAAFSQPQTTAPEPQHGVHHGHYAHPAPLSTQQQPNTQFNAWSSPFQTNVFNSVDYAPPAMSHQPLPQHHQLQMLPNNLLPQPQQTHPGHPVHGSRPQAPFDSVPLSGGSPPFRNGSLSHQPMDPHNGDANHTMNQ